MKFLILTILLLATPTWCWALTDVHNLYATQPLTSARPARFWDDILNNKKSPIAERDPAFWRSLARNELNERLQANNIKRPKSVIFFLGDGMSLSTVTAARTRKGQLKGNPGEEDSLSFEKFPHTGFSKTYCTDSQVADSACTATAYLCGIKANIATVGVTAKVKYNDCTMSMNPENHVSSIAEWAKSAGKSTGFITTTTLTHASPSGLYAKSASRTWECDSDIPEEIRQQGECMDLASQLITQKAGRSLDLLMGGGMGKFLPKSIIDAHGKAGERSDGKNLLQLWQTMNPRGVLVTNRTDLLNISTNRVSKIMGIFNSDVMDFHQDADAAKKPTLAEMTKVALEFLSRNKRGYFIFIEGGLIDYANHYNRPFISTHETIEMDKAIQVALNSTNPDETLIVVSSDHAHPLTISGFPARGTNILGFSPNNVDRNGVAYTTLSYPKGTHQYLGKNGQRQNIEELIADEKNFVHPSQISSSIGNHAGDDVGIYATGPQSHLFRGVMEQHFIPHLMAYAACIGNGRTLCD